MIVAHTRVPLDAVGEAAADLLTELYAVGRARGIAHEDWDAVTSLPLACLDVTRAQARRQRPMGDRSVRAAEVQPSVLPAAQPVRRFDQPGPGRAR